METGQRDELEFIAYGAQFFLEPGDGGIVQLFLPVEGWRAVISQHLAGEFRMDRIGKLLRESQVRLAGLAPYQVDIRAIRQRPGNRLIKAGTDPEETFHRAFPGTEWLSGRKHTPRPKN